MTKKHEKYAVVVCVDCIRVNLVAFILGGGSDCGGSISCIVGGNDVVIGDVGASSGNGQGEGATVLLVLCW